MSEQTITAEDLSLYALHLLNGEQTVQIDLLLQNSAEAREELARIRGDLAVFAFGTEQHTPQALTRQRLLKQVARERRTVPIAVPLADGEYASMQNYAAQRQSTPIQADRAPSNVVIPRVVGKPQLVETFDRADESLELPTRTSRVEGLATDAVLRPEDREVSAGDTARVRRPQQTAPAAAPPAKALFQDDAEEDRYTPSSSFAFTSFENVRPPKEPSGVSKWFAWTGWAAAGALAAAGVFAVRDNRMLRQQVQTQTASVAQLTANNAKAQMVMQTLQSASTQRFVLARTDTAPVPSARVAYLPDQGTLVFQGSNLDALPPYKTYELWLIPAGEGQQPVPAGTFKPDARGYASVVLPEMPKGTIAANFGVTLEDDGGSSAPTLPILLIGQQS